MVVLTSPINDPIDQRCCPLVAGRGTDINFVSIAAHLFCTCAVCGKSDIYGTGIGELRELCRDATHVLKKK